MVGRSAELDRTVGLFAALGDPQVAMVSGEAGVGKSRLVRELTGRLPAGTTVLVGRARPSAPGRPFHVLLEAVEPAVRGWDRIPASLSAREDPLMLLLAPVAPRLAPCEDRQYGGEELLQAGIDLVLELAGDRPAVLVFEDLHWADADSVALLGELAVTAGVPLLLIGTYRPEELSRGHPVAALMAGLDRERTVAHVNLDRLDRAATHELLAAVYQRPVPFRVGDAMHQRTGGNPFFLEELIAAAGSDNPEALDRVALPWSLSEAVLARLAGLDPWARRVAETAAVLGQRIPFDVLGGVGGVGEDQLIGVLHELVEGGVLVESEPDVFSFRHELTREAVADHLLGRERRRLHEKALGVLLESGSDDWAALAHHAAGAGRYDELLDVARQGARHYLRVGSTHQALRLAELGLTEADTDLDLLEMATRAAWAVGQLGLAIEHAGRWLAAAEGDPPAEVEAMRLLARLYWEAGDRERHEAMVAAAVTTAEALGPSPALAGAASTAAESSMLRGEGEAALAWAERALTLARELGVEDVVPAALVNKGSVGRSGLDMDEREKLLKEGIEAAQARGDHHTALRGFYNLLHLRLYSWPLEVSHATLRQAIDVAERAGRDDWSGPNLATVAIELHVLEGDLTAARAAAAAGRRRSPGQTGHAKYRWLDVKEAELALASGDLDRATALSEDLAPVYGTGTELEGWYHGLRAQLAAARGDLGVALEEIRRSGVTPEPEAGFEAMIAALHAGADASAVRALVAAMREAHCDDGTDPGWPDELEGALREAEGDAQGALEAYDRAVAFPATRPAPHAAACHLGAARVLVSLGRRDEARARAGRADALLCRWPGPQQAEARRLFAELGGRARAPTTPVPASAAAVGAAALLTRREREVAALLAEGLTNAEVAQRLYISTKTAAVHVSNILTKLAMSSRAEVAAWAVAVGLATPLGSR